MLAEAGYRVIVPDMCGYNLSDKTNGVKPYRVDALVGEVPGLIDALGYQKVNLAGHDWGAVISWDLPSNTRSNCAVPGMFLPSKSHG